MIPKRLTICLLLLVAGATDVIAGEKETMAGMTEAHNAYREMKGIQPLTWSDTLSAFAQQWANYLAAENLCHPKHRPRSGAEAQLYGENLYWASAVRWSTGKNEVNKITPLNIVASWADEAIHYDYQSNSCTTGKSCGHYTQLMWKNTKKVGCGRALCTDNSQIWVCNYDPPGNYIGEKPY